MSNIELTEAIEKLYAVFGKYSLKQKIASCPCCVEKEAEAVLHYMNLRDLSGDDLNFFAFRTMTTFGDTNDFKHFLPRLCELVSEGELKVNEEILFGKLVYGEWRDWERAETAALEDFFFALLRNALADASETGDYAIESFFAGIMIAVPDARPFFDVWFEDFSKERFRKLNYFVFQTDCALSNAFVHADERLRQRIYGWLISEKTVSILEKHFFAARDDEFEETLGIFLDYLYMLQKQEEKL